MKALSIPKDDGFVNEDFAKVTKQWIAVSDGAGGGGVFADYWSNYLVNHLPDNPINDFASFDRWIDGIWETFYNDCEALAKLEGGMLLNKFYDEGSFATLVAVWSDGHWVSYGDSVAFCYDKQTKELQHTFSKLVDFNNPPYLINCKDPLKEDGFKSGSFNINNDTIVFTASDALAHYILMMYEVAHKDKYEIELQQAVDAQTKDSNFIKAALGIKNVDFDRVLSKLLSKNRANFIRHIKYLKDKGLIAYDDYSLAVMNL